jgi:hypothetical protein
MSPPLGAYTVKNVTCTFGGGDYANQFTKARLVPDTPVQTLRTLVPDGIVQDVDSAVWTLELSGAQDWTAAQGLARYLHDHHGETVEVVLTPKASGVSATFDVLCMSVEFGGEQGNWATFEVTLPVQGTPEFTDP